MSLFSVLVFGGSLGVVVGCLVVLTIFTIPTIIRQQASIESLLRELVEASHREEMRR